MNSGKLTPALAPRIIAEVASALANVLLISEAPGSSRGRLRIWRTRPSRIEHDLRALAAHPATSSESYKLLERGYREVRHQVESMRREAEKQVTRVGASPSRKVQAERWSRSSKSAQTLLGEIEQMYQHLEGYRAAIAAGHDYVIERARASDIGAIPGDDSDSSSFPDEGGMLY